jgi:hypothetical protein
VAVVRSNNGVIAVSAHGANAKTLLAFDLVDDGSESGWRTSSSVEQHLRCESNLKEHR